MLNKQFLKTIGVVYFALVVLAGCRPEEQGRPLKYNAGIYPGGAPASAISEASLAELRQRARLQGGVSAGNRGGSALLKKSRHNSAALVNGVVLGPRLDEEADHVAVARCRAIWK